MLRASNKLERLHSTALRRYASLYKQPRTTSDDPQLPRHLRRQTKFASSPSQDPSSSSGKVYRSRHYDPNTEKNKDKSNLKLLDPYTLSSRLKKLCDANQIDSAVQTLKNSPRDAQNTQVWNTLIWECLKAKRFSLSYELYTDMKRRGFSPTTRTFQTMFTGLSKIENWSAFSVQLQNAHSLYDSFQRYMNSVRKHEPTSPELTAKPLASYIKILGDNRLYQKILDVYNALPADGQGSAEELVYTAMFQAIASTPAKMHNPSISLQSEPGPKKLYWDASDAHLLWTDVKKASKKSPSFQIDTPLVTAAIAALSRGKVTELRVALDIITEYFGLTTNPLNRPSTGTLPLSSHALNVIFRHCNLSRRHALCVSFFQQVKSRPADKGGVEILDYRHLNEVLKAHLSLPEPQTAITCLEIIEWMLKQEILGKSGYKIRPNIVTYNLAMTACWRDVDWRTALRIFELMTGYHSHDFMDGSVSSAPRRDARSKGRNLDLEPETLCSFVRTALASRNRANVRQSLRIIDYIKAKEFFLVEDAKVDDAKSFFTNRLALAIIDSVKFASQAERRLAEGRQSWQQLADAAAQYIARAKAQMSDSDEPFIPTMVDYWPEEKVNVGKIKKSLE